VQLRWLSLWYGREVADRVRAYLERGTRSA